MQQNPKESLELAEEFKQLSIDDPDQEDLPDVVSDWSPISASQAQGRDKSVV